MAHWQHRPEPRWKEFKYSQPYARGLRRLKEEVLAKTDFDPATLWQWGTMQAMALIEVLESAEAQFGEAGQKLVCDALTRIGRDIGRQILEGAELPADITDAEFTSFFATVINRIAYASLEEPRIDSEGQASIDILWCPHQDHYKAFDCRVQRYFVQGMIEAAREMACMKGWEVRFDTTIPSGAKTCHFTLWKPDEGERQVWQDYTKLIEAKALSRAARPSK
jgi:hypothetical protein